VGYVGKANGGIEPPRLLAGSSVGAKKNPRIAATPSGGLVRQWKLFILV